MTTLQPSPGPIVQHADLERAVCETLADWVPFYLAHLDDEAGRDRGATRAPRYYDAASDDNRRWMEEAPPSVLVISRGTINDPERHGDNATYGAWWQVNIAVTASGATEAGSRDLASRLGAAITYVVAQQGDFGEFVERTEWRGTQLDQLDRERPVMIAEVAAECWIPSVVSTRGPTIPRVLPADITSPADPIPQPDSATVDTEIRTSPPSLL